MSCLALFEFRHTPSISVGFLLDDAWLFYKLSRFVFFCLRIVCDLCREGKIRADIKRRIDVDEIYLSGEFGQEAGQDVFFVAAR